MFVVEHSEEQIPGYSPDEFDFMLDKIVNGRLDVDDVVKRHRRVRRNVMKKDTIEHVTKIMESIEEELDDLKVKSSRKSLDRSALRQMKVAVPSTANSSPPLVRGSENTEMPSLTGGWCQLHRGCISRS